MKRWTRFLVLASLALAGAALAAEPIKIGAMYILSGNFANYGTASKQGVQLAVEEINARGGILGRPVEVIFVDHGKPDQAVREAKRLILENKVDFLFGIDSSSVSLAVAPVANEYKVPLIVTHAATPRLTEMCLPYVFRTSNNARMDSWAAAAFAAKQPYKRWANIGPDYEFGRVSWEDFITRLKELKPDVEVVSEQWPKFGSSDYSSYITALMRAKPEAVFSSLWGGDFVSFGKQAIPFGFFKTIKFYVNPTGGALQALEPLGKSAPEGLLVSARYWFLYPETDANKAFVEKFHEKFGDYPSYNAGEAYSGMMMLAAAIEKAGSTDPDAVKAAFEADGGLKFESIEGLKWMRPADHQVFEDLVWGYTKHTDAYPFAILDPIVVVPAKDTLYPTKCAK
ncbi:ABC transporter substrate-binding protein [Oceanithermus sp.]|uniref:ABC transporter substrate-binding protein n=1 Tax=Oceanithermus sp. TaxID=2268145 RepID=UPI0025DBA0A4|nr:ABC transporter substrate-binding protein [Oceanithermus sp.]